MGKFIALRETMCQCCEDSNAKCGCPRMKRVQIRATILLCVVAIVDGCCFGMFSQPYSVIDCGKAKTQGTDDANPVDMNGAVIGMPWGPMCVHPGGKVVNYAWQDDESINLCTQTSNDNWYGDGGSRDPCQEYEDAGNAYGGSMGLISAAMFFNNFVGLAAFLELMGYTVGSKCQAAYVIIGGLLTVILCLAAGGLAFAPGMTTGDKRVAMDFCMGCGEGNSNFYDAATISDPHVAGAPIGALIGGLFAITEFVIGCMMCAQAEKDKETLTLANASQTPL